MASGGTNSTLSYLQALLDIGLGLMNTRFVLTNHVGVLLIYIQVQAITSVCFKKTAGRAKKKSYNNNEMQTYNTVPNSSKN